MMDDLVTWLRRQLDEDERVAQNAPDILNYESWPFWVDVDDNYEYETTIAYRDRFPPKSRLREVEAKRRILDWLDEVERYMASDDMAWHRLGGAVDVDAARRLLALPYAGEPGYRDEWRP